MKFDDLKIGDIVLYGPDEVKITDLSNTSISFKSTKDKWSCSNIPLYEFRPGNSLTNIQMLTKK